MFLYHASGALGLLAILAASPFTSQASASDIKAGDLVIQHPWSRATPAGAPVGGGYLTILNRGQTPDKLISGSVDVAAGVEIHDMSVEDGIMKMRQLDGLEIPAGGSVTFSPSGAHLMFIGLKHSLKQGQRIEGDLVFEKAGNVKLEYDVEAIGAKGPAGGASMPGMDMN